MAEKSEIRKLFGNFATGVAVVTTMGPAGPIGMTINSFSSVSVDPPLVLFLVSRTSRLHPYFASCGGFAVNFLAREQEALSRQFAKPGLDRFGDTPWHLGEFGVPVLDGVVAALECTCPDVITIGDHDLVLGTVVSFDASENDPLLFFQGRYCAVE
jgi:3-hydroxy-9,10-secoandrosta-1,3,5(10)-triene-9,17-dione monooxygenase reductase component